MLSGLTKLGISPGGGGDAARKLPSGALMVNERGASNLGGSGKHLPTVRRIQCTTIGKGAAIKSLCFDGPLPQLFVPPGDRSPGNILVGD